MSDITGSGLAGRAFFNRLRRYAEQEIMPRRGTGGA
jgi:hypothetical protein